MSDKEFDNFTREIERCRAGAFQGDRILKPTLIDTNILSLSFRDNKNVKDNLERYLAQFNSTARSEVGNSDTDTTARKSLFAHRILWYDQNIVKSTPIYANEVLY